MTHHYKGIIDKQILVKVTSRERKQELLHCVTEAVRLAKHPDQLKWLFTLDEDDPTMPRTVLDISDIIPAAMFRVGISHSKVHAINRDVPATDWSILVNLSDDQVACAQDWDETIRQAMPADTDASLWFNDGRQDRLNTMEIVGRAYYNRFGYIYYPEYKSFFCDNEAHEVAAKLGKLIKSPQVLFKHFHPSWVRDSHMKHDAVYQRAEKFWDHDQKLYNSRKLISFGL